MLMVLNIGAFEVIAEISLNSDGNTYHSRSTC